jgi:hypothetical protein
MKHTTIASIIAAALIAPTATFAQSAVFDFPTFYPEFTEQPAQPATKLSINTSSKAVKTTTKANTHK